MKKALITGIHGQDGSYLAKFLAKKGYEVHGLSRHASFPHADGPAVGQENPNGSARSVLWHRGDLTDANNLMRVIERVRPGEIYNLAAQSGVAASFESPESTANVDALGTLRLLEAVRVLGWAQAVRFYQASTSELFGLAERSPQSESAAFHPRSPYSVAKLYAYWITVNYREAYGMYACNGILFNHESPLRGEAFVTRKITRTLARIKMGLAQCLYLGNMDVKRDWGHAQDYVEMMWMMLQQEAPEDFVIATGRQFTVRQFVNAAAEEMDMPLDWRGRGLEEQAFDARGRLVVAVDPRLFRPADVENVVGDASKARTRLGWQPRKTFRETVAEMAASDLRIAGRERHERDSSISIGEHRP